MDIKKKYFMMRVVKHRATEMVVSPSVEIHKTKPDKTLSNLV